MARLNALNWLKAQPGPPARIKPGDTYPVYMQALSGNTNDQKAFAEVTRHHIQCLKAAQQCRYFVADAALYTEESNCPGNTEPIVYLTSPHDHQRRRAARKQRDGSQSTAMSNGYHGCWVDADYAGVG